MDTASAFARGAASRGQPERVFDWDKAARLIHDSQFDAPCKVASAGLQSDWEYTGGEIYRDGKPVDRADTYTFLASTWAIPELDIDGYVRDCWIWEQDTDWDSHTYWPQSALDILKGVGPNG